MKPTSPSLLAAGLLALAACSWAPEYAPGPDSLMTAVQETVVVDTGEIYAAGQYFPAPNRLEARDGAVLLNGIQIYPPVFSEEILRRPVSSRDSLDEAMKALKLSLLSEGKSKLEVAETVAEFYRSQAELVEDARVLPSGNVSVRYRGQDWSVTKLLFPRQAERVPTPQELAAHMLHTIVRDLRDGKIVVISGAFYGSGFSLEEIGLPERVAAEIDSTHASQ